MSLLDAHHAMMARDSDENRRVGRLVHLDGSGDEPGVGSEAVIHRTALRGCGIPR